MAAHRPALVFALLTAALLQPASARAQITRVDRMRAETMLEQVQRDLDEHYYDSTFKGVDLAARFAEARAQIAAAQTPVELFGGIVQALFDLDDSHTFFMPPGLTVRVDYGWDMQFFGDTCRITAVRSGTDAASQGLTPGTAILEVNGYAPTRRNIYQLLYVYRVLRPQRGLRIVARAPGAAPRQLDIAARVTEWTRAGFTSGYGIRQFSLDEERFEEMNRSRHLEPNDTLLIWRLPAFTEEHVKDLLRKLRGRKQLILDLRGNPGGLVSELERLIGAFFAEDVEVGRLHERRRARPMVARGRGDKAFDGELIVLVDAGSASAAETFARTMQLRGRGVVMGDRTAGAATVARWYEHSIGVSTVVVYGTGVTVADLVMPDGGRLEGGGAVPDVLIIPSGEDLAAARDPVLALAAERFGLPRDSAEKLKLKR